MGAEVTEANEARVQLPASTSQAIAKSTSPVVSTDGPKEEAESVSTPKEEDLLLLALPSNDKVYYYSDSDDDSDREASDFYPPPVTNRGNKLKRGARNVRKGNLGRWPRFGSDHEEAVRKRMRIELHPSLSLQSKRSALESAPRLPPLPRNPAELMTSPVILRTFATKQSHLTTLALSAVNLIEADAPMLRVLGRVCDVLRGDRVPFIEDRVREMEVEHQQEAEERQKRMEEAAEKAAANRAREHEAEIKALEEAKKEAEAAGVAHQAGDIAIDPALGRGAGANDIPVTAAAIDEADMDVDGAEGETPSRSTSPEPMVQRRRRGRKPAVKANATFSRDRTPTPDIEVDEEGAAAEDGEPDIPLDQMIRPEPGAAPGSHLPPSLQRLAQPAGYVRSLFVTEDTPVTLPGVSHALEADDQYRTLHACLTELQRFLADTIEYQERLGEIRDGSLGIERRRKGLYAILRLLARDYLDYEATRA